jgi:hypothetical protein
VMTRDMRLISRRRDTACLRAQSGDAGLSSVRRRLAVACFLRSPVRIGSCARDRSDKAKSDLLRKGMHLEWPWLVSSAILLSWGRYGSTAILIHVRLR